MSVVGEKSKNRLYNKGGAIGDMSRSTTPSPNPSPGPPAAKPNSGFHLARPKAQRRSDLLSAWNTSGSSKTSNSGNAWGGADWGNNPAAPLFLNSSPFEEPIFRSQSASPFLHGSSNKQKKQPIVSQSHTPGPPSEPKKDEKKKHGSYKIWHRNASEELQEAYNAIYGLPLYGSLCFVGRRTQTIDEMPVDADDVEAFSADNDPLIKMVLRKRFDGPSDLNVSFSLNGSHYDAVLSSGGKDDGDFSKIIINGDTVGEDCRGINLVALTPLEPEYQARNFDTHGLPEEANKLASFIEQLPYGSIILGSVRDDGSKFLGASGRHALRSIGVRIPQADDYLRLRKVVQLLPPERTRVLLTVCAKANASRCARVLLSSGWNIHTRASHTMNTPLHDAVYQCNAAVAIVLLDFGADPGMENKWGETPENIAQKKFGYASMEEMIMSSDSHVSSVLRIIGI